MRNVIAALAAGMLSCSSLPVAAKGDTADPWLVFARNQAPDVRAWDQIADGYYEGTSKRGDHVRIFVGLAGAKLDLAEERSRLRQIEEHRSTGPIDAHKALDRGLAVSRQRIAYLTRIIESHSNAVVSEKSIQLQNTFGDVCRYTTTGVTEFEALNVIVDYPRAKATLQNFGDGTFGPFPPFPVAVGREVAAGVGASSPAEIIDYDYSTTVSGQIVAEVTGLTFGGSCFMRTLQGISAQCSAGGAWEYFNLIRDQTCSGVIAGTPPTES